MKLGRRVALLAALAGMAALAMFTLGGGPASADALHPTCTWTVDKTAHLHGDTHSITSLDLALGETVTVDYSIVVTRTCPEGFNPADDGNSADVTDSFAGTLALHLFSDNNDLVASNALHPFTYSRNITASTCDSFDVANTVNVFDSVLLATDSLTIHVNVHCNQGCTLTPGYWKTHSKYGPAPLDATWAKVGEDTTFFLSGKTYYQVINTPPAGNAYYILSFQYIAAKLNILNGASVPASVTTAFNDATTLFSTYTPAQIGALSGGNALRQRFINDATVLGNYNSGIIGPGHCSESQ